MYIAEYEENGTIIETLETDDLKEISKFFCEHRFFENLQPCMDMIKAFKPSDGLRFRRRRNDTTKFIYVSRV